MHKNLDKRARDSKKFVGTYCTSLAVLSFGAGHMLGAALEGALSPWMMAYPAMLLFNSAVYVARTASLEIAAVGAIRAGVGPE